MNKAFIREPDLTIARCPRCGSSGQQVGREAVQSYLPEGVSPIVADPSYFCPSPQCDVAYFDAFDRVVFTSDLTKPVYPKDPDAPLCACFGLTRHDIEQDVREGVVTRVKAILEKAGAPEARCACLAANGQPCTAYVQKYYMQCRGMK